MIGRRHARQARLLEVGAAGQARICAAAVVVPGEGLTADVAARYLAGAGVGAIVVTSAAASAAARAIDPDVCVRIACTADMDLAASELELPLVIANPSARAVALGAYRALVALRRALAEGA